MTRKSARSVEVAASAGPFSLYATSVGTPTGTPGTATSRARTGLRGGRLREDGCACVPARVVTMGGVQLFVGVSKTHAAT